MLHALSLLRCVPVLHHNAELYSIHLSVQVCNYLHVYA